MSSRDGSVSMKRLLIVEDEPNVRKMLSNVFRHGTYEKFEAEDGKAALEIARAKQPDVVILDLMLRGDLDGFQVCEAIKADPTTRGAFVVILTGLDAQGARLEAERVGADTYFVKPVSPALLIETIQARPDLVE